MAGMLRLGKNTGSLEGRRGGWMLGALGTLLMTVWLPGDWPWQPQCFKEKTLLCFAEVGKSL